ncbi:uncharacterized protein LOC113400019 isoform X1 [Vanessa tameamea]|uniref:Uncharacterized protein LOC113400019 isoform X1 n=1 Tax=Vanessa tameamea TaxID=334116 RepID=A0A8B8IDL4_VANTA|nr:uncharacterized protein LOC113400019 isoform X1 [Vanessa tameamea]
MKSVKITLWMVTICLCFFILIIYHLYHFSYARNHHKLNDFSILQPPSSTKRNYDTPMRHIPLNEIYKDISDNEDSIEFEETKQVYMIDTPGCRIPIAMVNYSSIKKWKRGSCGNRAVYLKRVQDSRIRASIKEKNIRKYLKRTSKYKCCYRYFQRSTRPGFEHRKLRYTECKDLKDSELFLLESDFINVQCFEVNAYNKSHLIYQDVYAFCRKINTTNIDKTTKQKRKYSVLILGMDSMSLSRFVQTMTRTVTYLKNNFWPGFRGYHKVGDNTFPNLMAALTGQNLSNIISKCSKKMDQCNELLIWSIFKKSGYVTAYGEDYLQLPDIFSRDYLFRRSPTDHYMRPFFLKGEHEKNNHSLLCSGKVPSGQQLLDYAYDFVLTYRESPFFGFFWMNSFSHNINNHPQDVDQLLEDFLNRLTYTGVLDKTFIVFLSDHGIRFGEHRLTVESYYDDRLPSLFLWIPELFKYYYPHKVKAILLNQFRLVTPYDLFDTLYEISELTNVTESERYDYSSRHQSIFSIISANRTCQDVGIHDKWCSCHKLYPLDVEDTEGIKSVYFVAGRIRKKIKNIKTKKCWSCMSLGLQNTTRIHFYFDNNKVNLYYVVAFSMRPRNIFYEATVARQDTNMSIVGSINIISPYKGFGDCTINHEDRIFCVCQKNLDCRINSRL